MTSLPPGFAGVLAAAAEPRYRGSTDDTLGYEYRLEFDLPSHAQADEILRGIGGFEKFSEEFGLYSFRRESTGVMPDVDAKIEASGIYLCSYGGAFEIVTEIQAAFAAIGLHAELAEV